MIVFVFSSWQLQFIQSEFKGQLPQPYASGPLATQMIPAHMNDQNLEEPTRYVGHSDTLACLLTHGCWSYKHCYLHFNSEISILGRWIYVSATI